MSRFRKQDNLIGQANVFLEVLEQISQILEPYNITDKHIQNTES